jgi:hypothetical protein
LDTLNRGSCTSQFLLTGFSLNHYNQAPTLYPGADMNQTSRAASLAIPAVWLVFAFFLHSGGLLQTSTPAQKGTPMHATGRFDVALAPQPADSKTQDPSLGRMTIEKQIHGELEATSNGQMLTAGTDVKGSGVYVAVERVTGKLRGRSGSFSLYHTGVMTRGVPQLTITVVPDSGTGELAGIAGTLTITIAPDGAHSYDFTYTLPDAN